MEPTRSMGLTGFAALFISWGAALMTLVTTCSLVKFVSSQNGLGRDVAPNCTALMSCESCRFFKNFTAHALGRAWSPQWEVFWRGLVQDVLLLAIFGLQHSVMASSWWKNMISAVGPLGRTVYVGCTAICLQLLMQTWVPLDFAVWCIDTSKNTNFWYLYASLHVLFWFVLCGNLLVLDISELCGVKQCCSFLLWGVDDPITLKSADLRRLYSHLRHPGLIHGFILVAVHPVMTLDRLVLGASLVLYFLSRSRLDEDDVEYGNRMMRWKRVETSPKQVRF